jgi:hypothetical protein
MLFNLFFYKLRNLQSFVKRHDKFKKLTPFTIGVSNVLELMYIQLIKGYKLKVKY